MAIIDPHAMAAGGASAPVTAPDRTSLISKTGTQILTLVHSLNSRSSSPDSSPVWETVGKTLNHTLPVPLFNQLYIK